MCGNSRRCLTRSGTIMDKISAVIYCPIRRMQPSGHLRSILRSSATRKPQHWCAQVQDMQRHSPRCIIISSSMCCLVAAPQLGTRSYVATKESLSPSQSSYSCSTDLTIGSRCLCSSRPEKTLSYDKLPCLGDVWRGNTYGWQGVDDGAPS